MLTYYIKQKMLSIRDKYYVYDNNHEQVFEIRQNNFLGFLDKLLGSIFSLNLDLFIYNINGQEVIKIHKKMGFIWEKFSISNNKNIIADITQEKSLALPKINITTENCNYVASTTPLSRHFTIKKDEELVCEIQKKRLSLTDYYEITVYDELNYLLFISTAIAIDNSFYN